MTLIITCFLFSGPHISVTLKEVKLYLRGTKIPVEKTKVLLIFRINSYVDRTIKCANYYKNILFY